MVTFLAGDGRIITGPVKSSPMTLLSLSSIHHTVKRENLAFFHYLSIFKWTSEKLPL